MILQLISRAQTEQIKGCSCHGTKLHDYTAERTIERRDRYATSSHIGTMLMAYCVLFHLL